ncbi:hypothetical protein V6N11_021811 [Hibiscus sabdariffa]|uniref:Uncharacterized protein n=1 Tax=Hibiscus sabdariffa TaxID=183260 RepID=A0ABR2THP4_9ROSI
MVGICPMFVYRAAYAPLWRAVSAAWSDLRSSIAWSLGLGDVIHPLDDTWIPLLGPLRSQLLSGDDASQVRHVSDLLDCHGRWDVDKISCLFFPAAIPHILSIRCPDALDILHKPNPIVGKESGLYVCHKNTLLLMASMRAKLMTNMERYRRSLCLHPNCHVCQSAPASVLHRSVTWDRYFSECASYVPHVHPPAASTHRWQRSKQGWICLNTDGAVSSNMGIGSIGGIFCADDGSWILGFNKTIRVLQPLTMNFSKSALIRNMPSYKDVTAGNSEASIDEESIPLDDDDIELFDDDVRVGISDGIL